MLKIIPESYSTFDISICSRIEPDQNPEFSKKFDRWIIGDYVEPEHAAGSQAYVVVGSVPRSVFIIVQPTAASANTYGHSRAGVKTDDLWIEGIEMPNKVYSKAQSAQIGIS